MAARYRNHIQVDLENLIKLNALDGDELQVGRRQTGDALLLQAATPLLRDEIRGLVSQIILVKSQAEAGLLHGFADGGSLTANRSVERHISPLREDKRPMKGLVHAAYVLARMHFAMGAFMQPGLVECGHITAEEELEARRRYEGAAWSFKAANATIAAGARFTSVGQAVFAQAERYMRDAEAAIAFKGVQRSKAALWSSCLRIRGSLEIVAVSRPWTGCRSVCRHQYNSGAPKSGVRCGWRRYAG